MTNAWTGPLCEESTTSLLPLVNVWRHVNRAVDPAATVILYGEGVVGLGPPLQAMSLLVTSVIGPSYVGSRIAYPTAFLCQRCLGMSFVVLTVSVQLGEDSMGASSMHRREDESKGEGLHVVSKSKDQCLRLLSCRG